LQIPLDNQFLLCCFKRGKKETNPGDYLYSKSGAISFSVVELKSELIMRLVNQQ
jgi:hypothetical protein